MQLFKELIFYRFAGKGLHLSTCADYEISASCISSEYFFDDFEHSNCGGAAEKPGGGRR